MFDGIQHSTAHPFDSLPFQPRIECVKFYKAKRKMQLTGKSKKNEIQSKFTVSVIPSYKTLKQQKKYTYRIGQMNKNNREKKENRRREKIKRKRKKKKKIPKTYRIRKANIECEQKLYARIGVCVLNVSVLDSLSTIPFTLRQFDFAYPMAYISICMFCAVCFSVLCCMYIIVWYKDFRLLFSFSSLWLLLLFFLRFLHKHT